MATNDYPMAVATDTLMNSYNDTFTIQSQLTFPSDIGCTADQQNLLWQAFTDVIVLGEAVGPPELVLGRKPGDESLKGPAAADYYGREADWPDISLRVESMSLSATEL